jgi:hypothetical protein
MTPAIECGYWDKMKTCQVEKTYDAYGPIPVKGKYLFLQS